MNACKTCGTDMASTPASTHPTRTAKPEYRGRVCWVCVRLMISILKETAETHAMMTAAGAAE